MGRPAQFDREQALDTIMQALWRHGFEACSLKALAETLGITRSSFYNAFETREAAFMLALRRYLATCPDAVLADPDPDLPVRTLLTRMFREICRARAADPDARGCLAVNTLGELVGSHATLGPHLAGLAAQLLDRLEALIARAVAAGELPPDTDPRATALAVHSLQIGVNVMSKAIRDEAALWQTCATTLRGLGLLDDPSAAGPGEGRSPGSS